MPEMRKYYYRGSQDGTPVYSETTATGNVCYPWESRSSVRAAASRDGFKAVFVQTEIRGLPAILPAVLKTFVTNGAGGYLVQLLSDNEHGFVLADDDQTWPGGLGSGWSEWTIVERADVPPEVEARLGWLLDD